MLVLSRKAGEKVVLRANQPLPAGTEIEVTAVRISGDKARVGFEAPPTVDIIRKELDDASKGQQDVTQDNTQDASAVSQES